MDLLFLGFLNKLASFSKFAKNSITFVISNIFIFKVNFIIRKNTI